MRGQHPYLNRGCLQAWAEHFPHNFWLCIARDEQQHIQAMAFFFADDQGLYGRHWGAAMDYDCLHFELCYYQGIEFCLSRGIPHFDAGVQGQHRLLRGFEPVLSQSLHHLLEPQFAAAVAAYLQRETAAVQREWREQCRATAFKDCPA
jgi:predicted N-acyltransferase